MSHHAHAPALGRRRLTAALLSVPLLPMLTGCDDDVVDLPGLPPVAPNPDKRLLNAAIEAEVEMLGRVVGFRRRKELREILAGTRQVHDTHVDLLVRTGGDEDDEVLITMMTPGAPASLRTALEELARREKRLAARHVDRALAARSGPFARLMAVLAAAATQQSVLLTQAAAELPKGRRS